MNLETQNLMTRFTNYSHRQGLLGLYRIVQPGNGRAWTFQHIALDMARLHRL
jgi:hypothetical protein